MGLRDFFSFGKGTKRVKDPVCGMSIDIDKTKLKSTYRKNLYGFCSSSCKESFDKNPDWYV